MAIALVDSDAVGFADGDTPGHVYMFPAGAPSAGDLDVLCVNSNTVVSTPSGFTSRVSAVANQGSYVFTRKASGGEGSSVTVVTSGNENTTLTWSRWSGTDAYSAGNSAQANNSNNTVLPAASTGTLAATGMLVIAFGALHDHDGALATSPVWSNGFNALETASQGAAAASSSCVAFTAYKTNAGTASETINSVSWTNNVRNRYALWVAFTATAGGTDGTATPAATAATVALPAAAPSAASTVTPAATSATVAVPAASVAAGATKTPAALSSVIALPSASPAASSTVSLSAAALVVGIPAATASGSGSATATPAPVALVAALPSASPSAGARANPAAAALVVSLPATAASGGSDGIASPAALAVVAGLPAGTVGAGAAPSLTSVALSITVPRPVIPAQEDARGAGGYITASTPVGRITATTPGGRL